MKYYIYVSLMTGHLYVCDKIVSETDGQVYLVKAFANMDDLSEYMLDHVEVAKQELNSVRRLEAA